MKEVKTSNEWQELCRTIVFDPDGWDRQNYQYSWHEEQITRLEFEHRLCDSTCQWVLPVDGNIWRDKDE